MTAVNQGMLDALVQAWGTGALTVEYENRRMTYDSKAQLESRIATVAAALGVANPLTPAAQTAPPRVSYASFSKG
jgi:hypothetical protein